METRRSVRSYKPDMIPQEIIDRICEAGTYAASGMGKQHCEKTVISIIYNCDRSFDDQRYDTESKTKI